MPERPVPCSPTRLLNAGDEALAGHVAEADTADAELAVHRPRPPTQLAAALDPDLLARRHLHRGAGPPAGPQLRHLLAELHVLRFRRHRFNRFCSLPVLGCQWSMVLSN